MLRFLATPNAAYELYKLYDGAQNKDSIASEMFDAACALTEEGVPQAEENLLEACRDAARLRDAIFGSYSQYYIVLCEYLQKSQSHYIVTGLKFLPLYLKLGRLDYKKSGLPQILRLLEAAPINGYTAKLLLFPLQLIAVSEKKSAAILRLVECATFLSDKLYVYQAMALARKLGCKEEIVALAELQASVPAL